MYPSLYNTPRVSATEGARAPSLSPLPPPPLILGAPHTHHHQGQYDHTVFIILPHVISNPGGILSSGEYMHALRRWGRCGHIPAGIRPRVIAEFGGAPLVGADPYARRCQGTGVDLSPRQHIRSEPMIASTTNSQCTPLNVVQSYRNCASISVLGPNTGCATFSGLLSAICWPSYWHVGAN